MPAVISLKTATVSQLYQAGGPPVSTTIYGQTLIDFAKDSRFGGLLFPNSIPVTALQNINASKITTQSLSGAIGGTTRPGQLAWNTINTNNIVPQGIETAAIKDRAVNRNKIATESIFLEHFSETSLSEFANKISTGEISQKVNRKGDTLNGVLAVSGSRGIVGTDNGFLDGATFEVRAAFSSDDNIAYVATTIGADTYYFYPDGKFNGKNVYTQTGASPAFRKFEYTGTTWRYIDASNSTFDQTAPNTSVDYPWLASWTGRSVTKVQVAKDGANGDGAYLGFHRPWKYAVRFGLDSDNKLKIGGWSLGNNSYEILNANNLASYATSDTSIQNFYVRADGATTMTGNLNVRQNTSSGSVSLVTGDTTRPGYIAFIQPNGQRAGYIGWQNNNTTQLVLNGENGYTFRFADDAFIGNNKIATETYVQAATAHVLTQFPDNFVTTDGTTQNITGPKTFRATTPIRVERASNNDAIILDGRNGGTSSHAITITTASLGASRTYTLPDVGLNANFVLSQGAQTIAGDKTFSDTIKFGSSTRQMLDLFSTTYGIGVQGSSLYFRTNSNFRWYEGGGHSNTNGDPGTADSVSEKNWVSVRVPSSSSSSFILEIVGVVNGRNSYATSDGRFTLSRPGLSWNLVDNNNSANNRFVNSGATYPWDVTWTNAIVSEVPVLNTGANNMLLDKSGDLYVRGKIFAGHGATSIPDLKIPASYNTQIVNSNLNPAGAFYRYLVDTSTAALTLTLPASPSNLDEIILVDIGRNWHVNNLTVARNGKTINGGTSNLICNQRGVKIHLIYYNNDWKVII